MKTRHGKLCVAWVLGACVPFKKAVHWNFVMGEGSSALP